MELSTALKISGGAHGALVLWALVAGIFSGDFDEAVQFTEVSVISGAEFAALVERSGSGTPGLGAEPDAAPAPVPDPEPRPGPGPGPAPDAEPAVPEADTAPAVPEDAGAVLAPEPGDTPTPAPRVAPRPADRPERDVAVAPELQEAAEPAPADETPAEPAETRQAQAPEAATTRIVTEATEEGGADRIARAPAATPRPRTRPDRSAPAAEPEPVAQREPAPEPGPAPEPEPDADPLADAIAGAVADAVAGGGAAAGDPGPPMTAGERDALRLAVQDCWVVDVGSEAANVTVTVGMRMSPEGTVVDGSLRMIEATGGSDAAIRSAFQSARRAILRCQRGGYDLPAEKYAQWEEIEMVFNPEEMRLR